MSAYEDAQLILKLYDLRRETVMRQARTWWARDFRPTSAAYIREVMQGEQSAYYRMILGYWEMAATLVVHGAIDAAMFRESSGEFIFVFARIEPFLADLRKETNSPGMLANLEKVVRALPDSAEVLKAMRARMAAMAPPAAR